MAGNEHFQLNSSINLLFDFSKLTCFKCLCI